MASSQQFSDRVIAVTGAASGIGLCTANLLASRGAKLSLADVQQAALDKARADIQSRYPSCEVIASAVDVRQYDQVEKWINDTVSHFGKLDGAANLAGVIPKSIGLQMLQDQDFGEWEFVVGVNLTGLMYCMKAQLKAMADNGSVVNASSIAGLTGRNRNSAYSASKHGVLGLTRSAAKEVGVRGVRVNAICPGRIKTPMARAAAETVNASNQEGAAKKEENSVKEEVALRRDGEPEEVAHLIAYLLSNESTYITGNAISIDGGWNC